jgi:Ca2+-binding RTX toxin-like protein
MTLEETDVSKLRKTCVLVCAAALLAGGASVLAGGPAAARAGALTTVTIQNGVLRIVSDSGLRNSITLNINGSQLSIGERTGNTLTTQSPCTSIDATEVQCPPSAASSFFISSGGGNDQVRTFTLMPGSVVAGDGNDVVADTFSPAILIDLGAGDDGLRIGSGADTVFGGPGRDFVSYQDTLAPIEVRLDDATNDGAVPRDDNIHSDVEDIFGGRGPDILVGGDFDNMIDGLAGNDFEFGLGGNDTFHSLDAPDGADVMFGGIGTDTVTYIDRTDPVAVRLDGLAFDGFPGEGDNVNDDIENIIGTNRGDVLTGASATNDIHGLGGNDLIDGGLGADTLDAGPGIDTATYLSRTAAVAISLDDVANDGAAGELDNVASDFENITGGSGSDTLVGNDGSNGLVGEAGDDVLMGLGTNDLIDGGFGTDTMLGGSGTDTVTYAGRIGAVTVRLDLVANDGQAGELDLARGFENVDGGLANDLIVGNDVRNVLRGARGDDRLLGKRGNDLLVGEDGSDVGNGGTGTDTCQTETTLNCP